MRVASALLYEHEEQVHPKLRVNRVSQAAPVVSRVAGVEHR